MKYWDNKKIEAQFKKFTIGSWKFISAKYSMRGRDEITNGEDVIAFGTFRPEDANLLAASKDLFEALSELHEFCRSRHYLNSWKAEKAIQKASGK